MKIGLRIDVDTFRGTKYGVPNLCRILSCYSIKASFFFSVGPDNMGRHLWRLTRPSFFRKMLRTRASSLYGWDILLRGTFWPGPVIGENLGTIIRSTSDAGHEVGLHAWDHHAWQAHIDTMDGDAIYRSLNRGVELLTRIIGRLPTCSAVPGWKCKDLVLREKARFSFDYNSDCRGVDIFRPLVDGEQLLQPQIPVTLPTYDEVIGSNGITDNTYNDYILSLLEPEKLNVLTIHAEVEGMACFGIFGAFLNIAQSKGASFVPLGALPSGYPSIGPGSMVAREFPGREGWISCQAETSYMGKDAES
ncbi:MAG: 4-deoxy-4-formamido-L-arabinose-phosphoundecaprenol deformylase [Deltaproteobacteria bacterium]|nr:4-deoxy-4-formamido-L-arabinose-phosphoundecaprenol deformylase [Deltaproteobacteria bacterium]